MVLPQTRGPRAFSAGPRPRRSTGRLRSTIGIVLVLATAAAALVPIPAGASVDPLGGPVVRSDRSGAPREARRARAAAVATRGCRPPATPTPRPSTTPAPTLPPTASPSAAAPAVATQSPAPVVVAVATPSPTPGPSATPSPTRTPKPTPTPYKPPGIDVSHWNGRLPWTAIREAGMRFAIMKATQGTTHVDDLVDDHVRAARRQGLLLGAYHFFDYRVAGAPQAEHFVSVAREHGLIDGALPLAVDVECLPSLGWAEWSETVPRLRALVNRIYTLTGRVPLLYTSRHMWEQVTGSAEGFGHLPLWVACWRCSSPYLPTGWSGWRIWQIRPYAFDGMTQKLDGNIWKGTDLSLTRFRTQPMSVAGGASATNATEIPVDLPSHDGEEVRTKDDLGDWTTWRPRTETVTHPMTPGDGTRTVSVQLRYPEGPTGPVFSDDVILDTVAPLVSRPLLRLGPGSVLPGGGIPLDLRFRMTEERSGIAGATITPDCGPGSFAEVDPLASGPVVVAGSAPAGDCSVAIRITDGAGNPSTPEARAAVRLDLREDRDPALAWAGWSGRRAADALDGHLHRAERRGAALRFTAEGSELAIIAPTGPGRGRIRVFVDGRIVRTIDLAAPVRTPRAVVGIIPLAGGGTHAVTLRALAAEGATGLPLVEIDALVLLRVVGSPG